MTDNALSIVHGLGVALALFLIGANLSFLLHLGGRLVPWFAFKVSAITLLLVYVCASMAFGDPTFGRTLLGIAAMLADVLAIGWMWHSIVKFAKNGVVGIVPLLRVRSSDYDRRSSRR